MFLGERYKTAPNIIWMFGNDYQVDQWNTYDPFLAALSEGIRGRRSRQAPDDRAQHPNMSTSYEQPDVPALIDVASRTPYYPHV